MSVRKRCWGEGKEAWVADFVDAAGDRRIKTFPTRKEADRFAAAAKAIACGLVPEARRDEPIKFEAPLPNGSWRKGSARDEVAAAFKAAHPSFEPITEGVVVHIMAEIMPQASIADIDNLIKPVIDALKGLAWVDDSQISELLALRVPARRRGLKIKIWKMSKPMVRVHLKALAEAGLYTE